MFGFGFAEVILIAVLALIFIGPKQLPEVARVIARLLNEWKRVTQDLTASFNEARGDLHRSIEQPPEKQPPKPEESAAESKKGSVVNETEPQSLIEHLEELRFRLVRVFLAIFVGMGITWTQTDRIMDWIRKPIAPYLPQGGLIFTGVMDKFMAYIKVAAMGGLILSCPVWIYQLWKFVAPGLYKHERKYALFFIFFGSMLFLSGVSFVYFFVYPAAFQFLMTFGGATDKPMISIIEYLSFFTMTTIMFGVAFELPLILTLLAMLGLIDSAFLKSKRRYAVVLLAALAAILTPPDLISMCMMLVPLILLYESSIWIVYFMVEKKSTATTPTHSSGEV